MLRHTLLCKLQNSAFSGQTDTYLKKKVFYGGMGIIATIFYVFGQPLERSQQMSSVSVIGSFE